MALPQYATEQLLENIKRRCLVPTSQLTYTPQGLTDLANDTLQGEIVPLIMSTREDYFVTHVDVLSPADGVIDFPAEAVGSKLRNVCYYPSGNPLNIINLPRIDLDLVAGVGFMNYATLAGFYIEGNKFCLYPNTSVPTNTTIRIYYYKRVLTLAAPGHYAYVRSVDTNTNEIIVDSVPSDWEVGSELNTVSGEPNFDITNSRVTIQALSSPTITLDSVEDIEVGNYISFYGYSAIPMIPLEAHQYLAQVTAGKVLEGLGDREGMTAALQKAQSLKDSLLVMISNRIDGSPKKVINPQGGLRMPYWRRGWWGF